MQLTEEQKQKVTAWIGAGMKLSEIQNRLGEEEGLRLTYMEARLLVDDLKLMPVDPPEPPKPEPAAEPAPGMAPAVAPGLVAEAAGPAAGKVSITVDTLAKPGTMVSGQVFFSDGKKGLWYLDQAGRLGVSPEEQGYRPPAGDVEEFQMQLDRELQKLGY